MATDDVNDSRWWFGRLESKLDGMDEKLDHTAETLGRHEERILAVERDVRDWKTERAADRAAAEAHASSARVGIKIAVVTAALSALGSIVVGLLMLLVHH
ncbi:hypothetical protein ATK30_6865 [Amycolatopsis echigonensis]|uniref:Uncharacterized protein n=1 Tax=Amycolatopsis echigonensis TaxID=2576905 RepID=A0A2N3WQ06_9PSEU|nr:hypothetical protein [Amycolatopsis niigatensis]PKV95932.1 hypothetical protein ATK30_6865 [Amycolatopsis niigatensis]